MEQNVFDTIVIGSGPAGLAAAYAAAVSDQSVAVIEKQPRPGMKLLASGGGRCNVTNILSGENFAVKFGRQWRFMMPALQHFSGSRLLDFFSCHQVPLVLTDGFHYFPASGKAADVLKLFTGEISGHGGRIFCSEKVTALIPGDKWQVITSERSFICRNVICCCGGRGYPALGGSMAGFDLVRALGHTVTPLYPAMTGVICADERIGECAGISMPDCVAEIAVKGRECLSARGELLFTHRGFSAFAILDLAGQCARLIEKNGSVPLKIDFLPDMSLADVENMFADWRKVGGNRHISTLMNQHLHVPRRIAGLLLEGDDPEISRWQRASSALLAQKLKASVFQLSGVESWDKAMVTAGGVSLKEVSPHTLESKIHKGLFFAGEMLDLAGPCGGYNITWALASGFLAAGGVDF